MEGEIGDGGFSPRATVENIQRRLLRPSSLHSPPPTLTLTPLISSSLFSHRKDDRGYRDLAMDEAVETSVRDRGNDSANLYRGRNSSQFEAVHYTGLCRKRDAKEEKIAKKEKKKKKLEDYLDPILLSAISSKISRAKKDHEMIVKRKDVKDFEWPVDELRNLMDQDSMARRDKNDAVNLSNDSDHLIENSEDHGDDEFSTPFRKFEQTGLRFFKL